MLLTIYLLSLVLAPILAGILDRFYDTRYPADNWVLVVVSPVVIVMLIFMFIIESVIRLNRRFKFIKNPFQVLYNLAKGSK